MIPTHGGAGLLPLVLPPLLEDPGTAEVIVVADRDEEAERAVHALSNPRVRCVATDFGGDNGARQAGVEAARNETVVLLDDDVFALPRLISRHLRHDHRRRIVLGYMPVEPSRLRGARRFPARSYEEYYQEAVGGWEASEENVLRGFWAGNFSARRDDLLEIGIRNPAYRGTYHADADLGRRLLAAGFEAKFDRTAAAIHIYRRGIREYLLKCRRRGAAKGAEEPPVAQPSRLDRASVIAFLAATLAAGAVGSRRAERHFLWRLRRIEHRAGAYAAQAGIAEERGLLLANEGRRGSAAHV